MKMIKSDEASIKDIAKKIKDGGIAILPFDTVYGFACDPRNSQALEKIFECKKRPKSKTIGLAFPNVFEVEKIADLTDNQKQFITDKTPGRYTFIVKKLNMSSLNQVQGKLSGRQRHDPGMQKNISEYCIQNDTVAVRIPESDFILDIIKESGGIIAQTSANISGKPNCYSIDDLEKQYTSSELDKVDLIIDGGKIENCGASQIFDLTGTEPKIVER